MLATITYYTYCLPLRKLPIPPKENPDFLSFSGAPIGVKCTTEDMDSFPFYKFVSSGLYRARYETHAGAKVETREFQIGRLNACFILIFVTSMYRS